MKTLRERRLEAVGEIRKLADLANNSAHRWSAEDEAAWDKANATYEDVSRQIRGERLSTIEKESRDDIALSCPGARVAASAEARAEHASLMAGPDGPAPRESEGGGGVVFCSAGGRELRGVGPRESFASLTRHDEDDGGEPVRVGRLLAAAITGRVDSLEPYERRLMQAGLDGAGGFLISPAVSGQIIDLARSASVMMAAGAVTLPIDGEVRVVRILTDPTVSWRPEGASIVASDMTVGAATLRPRTVACLVPISIELAEDSPNAGTMIESVIRAAMAQAIDQAILRGSGSAEEPLGVLNNPDINSETSVGTPSDWSDLSSAIGQILTANYPGRLEDLSLIYHPRDAQTYADLVDSTTGQPLNPLPWPAAVRKFTTTALSIVEGVGGHESSMLVLDGSQVVVGLRRNITVQVFDSGSATDSGGITRGAVSQLLKWIRVYARLDAALLRPSWVTKLTGVTAA